MAEKEKKEAPLRKTITALGGLFVLVIMAVIISDVIPSHPRRDSGPPSADPSMRYRVHGDGTPYCLTKEEMGQAGIMPFAHAAIDGTAFQSGKPISVAYFATPSTLADGDQDIVHSDATHGIFVSGPIAAGSAVGTAYPVVAGLSDGTNVRRVKGDSSGNLFATGPAAEAAALSGNPLRAGGSDGTNIRTIKIDQNGYQYTSSPVGWYVVTNTADTVAIQAIAQKAAGASGVQHVCTGISAQVFGDGTGGADQVVINLRDGATGAGTIIAQWKLNLATGANTVGDRLLEGNLNFIGTAATAMTIESAAAGATHTAITCSMSGYDIKP